MMLLEQELNDCTLKNTERFSLNGKRFLCKCIKVYDGDTITIAFKPFKDDDEKLNTSMTNRIYKYSVRLSGIDTPEIRTTNTDEKIKAIAIRDKLRDKILNKLIYIECGKFDKYGRLLGYIFDENNKNINNWLINCGYAYEYNGGTKEEFK
jgi:endonuclease YncB( thermonuclease family)